MQKILVTGATGNVGTQVIKALIEKSNPIEIYAGIRDLNEIKNPQAAIKYVAFDFENNATQIEALKNCDILFLLRPPQLANTKKYFAPFIQSAKEAKIKHIIFLSVQGVEKSTIIPHHKIEKLIVESGIPYTFLRPAYFMQNFIGNLKNDLVARKRIFLPAGKSKFTLVDVQDLGKVTAEITADLKNHVNKAYELTSLEKLNFKEMAEKLSSGLGVKIKYVSPNLLNFYFTKVREGMPAGLVLVMIMLHYFPRFQKEPEITNTIEKITGWLPVGFEQFIEENKILLSGN